MSRFTVGASSDHQCCCSFFCNPAYRLVEGYRSSALNMLPLLEHLKIDTAGGHRVAVVSEYIL